MADYLLDTNILSYWYNTQRPEHLKVSAAVEVARQPDPQTNYVSRLFVSVVTLGEIEYGHRVAPTSDASKQAAYAKFVAEQCPDPLEMTNHVAEQYGELRAWLFENYAPNAKRSKAKRAEELVNPTTGKELGIDENDIWIAAQAKTYNFVLVTHDSRGNFGKVLKQLAADLSVEDWAS
ncbi:MAG: PIN domain-containing protein [Candidatus Hydrogenedentota bacterium]